MQSQLDLFPRQHNTQNGTPSIERIEGALTFSAIGDALGWPTEFGRYPGIVQKRFSKNWLSDFVPWTKRVGGRFWGYEEAIDEGNYSDDTQLTLAVMRCIDEYGRFNVEKFAFLELPSWIHYEKGGGRSIKTAARAIISKKKMEWWKNFYRLNNRGEEPLDYRNAGANGSAMRVMPIAIVDMNDSKKMVRDCFANTIVTHGHPRAILGCILYASLIGFLLRERHVGPTDIPTFLEDVVETWPKALADWDLVSAWRKEWNQRAQSEKAFEREVNATNREAKEYIHSIPSLMDTDHRKFYERTGALSPHMKGSGLSTVLTAAYMFIRYFEEPEKAVIEAVNTLGSDTDTISYFIGGLFGAHLGINAVPRKWLSRLQDKDYFIRLSEMLHSILLGESLTSDIASSGLDRQSALMKLYAWEIGLHELFWEAVEVGSCVIHPALGRGIVEHKEIKPLVNRPGYIAKLFQIKFDCGQTCTFHSRVSDKGNLPESFASELERSLEIPTLILDLPEERPLTQEEKRRQLEAAAEALLPDYTTDSELTAFTALDGEDFHE